MGWHGTRCSCSARDGRDRGPDHPGTRSRFNTATLDSTAFTIMGGLVAVIHLAALIIGLVIAFTPLRDATMRLAVGLGCLISVLGLSVGFLVLRPTPEQAAQGDGALTSAAHGVGVADGGPSIPIPGWSTTGGGLRIPHFIGMLALQLLPLFAIVLTAYFSDRLTDGPASRSSALQAESMPPSSPSPWPCASWTGIYFVQAIAGLVTTWSFNIVYDGENYLGALFSCEHPSSRLYRCVYKKTQNSILPSANRHLGANLYTLRL